MSKSIRIQQKAASGRYELKSILGSGGTGTVYKAWDMQLQRYVAFKRIRREVREGHDDDEAFREAVHLAVIQHPNILTVYDSGIDDDGPFIVTELLDGRDMERVVKEDGPLDLAAFRDVACQTLDAMIAAHHAGLIHRDLKPPNLMAVQLPSGAVQYKILDFGLAKIISKPTLQTVKENAIYGTVYFVAPEQISVKPVDGRTDLYALGCIYYYLLTGEQAFDGETYAEILGKHLRHDVRMLHDLRPDLPQPLCDWVMWLMNPDPDDRPESPADALDTLKPLMHEVFLDTGAIRPSEDAPTASEGGQRPLWTVVAVGLSMALLAGIGYAVFRPKPRTSVDAPALKERYDAHDLSSLKWALGREVNVQGRVTQALLNRNRTAIYVNFDEDYKKAISLSLLVSKWEESRKDAALNDLESLSGRTIEARGKVSAFRDMLHLRIEALEDIVKTDRE